MTVSMTWPEYLAGCCRIGGHLTRLSLQEADFVLALLLGHPERWTSRAEIVERVWPEPDKQPIDASHQAAVLICHLRRRGIIIENHRGFGFRIPAWARGRERAKLAA